MRSTVSIVAMSLLAAVSPAAAQDWSGLYGGAAVGGIGGSWQHLDGVSGAVTNSGDYSSGTIAGAFVGYNVQSGNMVYGGELAGSLTNSLCFEDYPEECSSKFLDLKGRVGYAGGNMLYYGVLGVSRAEYDYAGDLFTLNGLVYGVGVDYAFGNQYFVGGEILRRDMAEKDFFADETEHDFTSVSVRLGMKF